MVFPILGSGSATPAYDIENSLSHRGDGGLEWTPGSSTNRRTYTISMWIKNPVANKTMWGSNLSGYDYVRAEIMSDYQLGFRFYYSDTVKDIHTNALLKDPSAWYHLVWGVDTTQATDTNRVKIYMNGVQFTTAGGGGGFSTENYPPQNTDGEWGHTERHEIGGNGGGAADWPGYTAEVHYIDGTQREASDFGEFDAVSGIWKPKKYTGGSYGTLGFFLEYKQSGTGTNASGLGADTSGEDNHLACQDLTSLDQCTDTPTNNFCTLNPSYPIISDASVADGNLQFTNTFNSSPWHGKIFATMAVTSGKWYWEVECETVGGTAMTIGAEEVSEYLNNSFVGNKGVGYFSNGYFHYRGSEAGAFSTYTSGDVIGIALDMDNRKIYFAKNGTWQNSGDPTSGATGTGAAGGTLHADNVTMVPAVANFNSGVQLCNFGNPPFTISSGNADGNGYGNFEYAVPSGYYALCTKNLAEYG